MLSPQSKAPTSWIQRLSLYNFRCYSGLSLEFDPRPIVLVGENGAGKTNILEAISFLSPGRGLQGVKLSEVHQLGTTRGWSLCANVWINEALEEIETGSSLRNALQSEDRRFVKLNDHPVSYAELSTLFSVLWMTPNMDLLLTESMSHRRRFFDKLVSSLFPSHIQHLYRYGYVVKERSRLICDGVKDDDWLKTLENTIAEEGVAIASLRASFLSALAPFIQNSSSSFPKVALSLEGDMEESLKTMPALEVEEKIKTLLQRSRREDTTVLTLPIGPHQTRVQFFHTEKGIFSEFCSTGEQKALILGLVLANCRLHCAHKNASPILLLDDIAAHLDPRRREDLCKDILDLKLQCWMTGTDHRFFSFLESKAQYVQVSEHSATLTTKWK